MKKIILAILICAALLFNLMPVFALKNQVSDNIALGKPITASQVENGYPPENANDDSITTAWAPTGASAYLQVDLLKPYVVSRVEFVSRQDLNQPDTRRNFVVRASNDPEFTDYVEIGACGSQEFEHMGTWSCDYYGGGAYRYVRIAKTASEYFFINELRIFGTEGKTGNISLKAPKKFSDVSTDDYEITELLYMIDVMKGDADGLFHPDRQLKRADACQIIQNLLNLGLVSSEESFFEDVPFSYWGASSINALYKMGIVNGYSDGYFRPENLVSGVEFIKMLITGLGYTEMAEAKGGYPYGYLILAEALDFFDDVEFTSEKILSRMDAAKLVFNALSVNYPEFVGEGETVLKKFFDIRHYTGRVTGVDTTSLKSSDFLRESTVEIDEANYLTADESLHELLGYNVSFYVKEDKNEDIVLFAVPLSSNSVLKVSAEDIGNITNVTEFRYYDENGRAEEVSVAKNADVIYNKKLYNGFTYKDFMPQNGDVTLIDSNNDGIYETIHIMEYTDYVINSVSETSELTSIHDKYGSFLQIQNNKDNRIVFINSKNGNKIPPIGLEEWDSAEVYASKNNDYVEIVVSGDFITGTVESFDNEGYVVIDGTSHPIGEKYKLLLSSGRTDIPKITVGENVTVGLNSRGYITSAKTSKSLPTGNNVLRYGYVMGVSQPQGLDEEVQVLLFTTDNKSETYSFADKLICNDVSVNPDGAVAALRNITTVNGGTGQNGNTLGQLIKYKVNDDGKIKELYTQDGGALESIERNYKRTGSGDEKIYLTSFNGFVKEAAERYDFYLDSDTAVFTVPDLIEGYEYEITNENNYSSGGISTLSDWGRYSPEVFDKDEFERAGAIVLYVDVSSDGSRAKYDTGATVVLVESLAKSIDENGDTVDMLRGYSNGKLSKWIAESAVDLSNVLYTTNESVDVKRALSTGDVVRLSMKNGKINGAQLVFDVNDIATMTSPKTFDPVSSTPATCRVILGNVVSLEGKYMRISEKLLTGDASADESITKDNYDVSKASVFVYDSGASRNKLKKVNYSELANCVYAGTSSPKVFVRTNRGVLELAIIIR